MVEKLYLGFIETLPGRGASARVGGSVETARTEAQQNRKQANGSACAFFHRVAMRQRQSAREQKRDSDSDGDRRSAVRELLQV